MNDLNELPLTVPLGNRILVVDDKLSVCRSLEAILGNDGFLVEVATSGEAAVEAAKLETPHLVMLDLVMPGGMNGFETASALRNLPGLKKLPIIFVTTLNDMTNLERIFSLDHVDYICKPVNQAEVLARVRHHLTTHRQASELTEAWHEASLLKRGLLNRELEHEEVFAPVITCSLSMRSIFQYIEAIAATSRPVLITGETGTGKEQIAKCVHEISGRSGKLVAVNVAGLDDNLFTDTLFGHVKGAYTSADKPRAGLIEQAAGGTLFLDEIGDLGPVSQVKLLRLLQEREYYPLGSDTRKYTDARVIVATHSMLEKLIDERRFRQDLFYRLRTHTIQLPPLRERRKDVPLLFRHFLSKSCQQLGIQVPTPTQDLLEYIMQYEYPGNIRELESMVFDAVSRNRSRRLGVESMSMFSGGLLSPEGAGAEPRTTAEDWGWPGVETDFQGQFPTIRAMTDLLINKALERTNGNQATAATLLGLTRQALNKRLKRRREDEELEADAASDGDDESADADVDESADA